MFRFSSSLQPAHGIERNDSCNHSINLFSLSFSPSPRIGITIEAKIERYIFRYSSRRSIQTLTDRIASGKRHRDVFPFTRARVDLDSLSLSLSLALFLAFFLSFRSFSVTISSLRIERKMGKKRKEKETGFTRARGLSLLRTNDNKCPTSTRLVFLSLSSSNSLITKRRPFRGW